MNTQTIESLIATLAAKHTSGFCPKEDAVYLDWVNNFISFDKFCEINMMESAFATDLIDRARVAHEEYVAAIKSFELMDEQSLWLCYEIDANPADCTTENHDFYGLTVYSVDGAEYAVGTDREADDAWDQSLESYIDECIMPEIKDENLRNYFDCEKWKRDAKHDGRGHSLASYDGNEIELGGGFAAFRIN